jgi:excisionase family DNA binding protein
VSIYRAKNQLLGKGCDQTVTYLIHPENRQKRLLRLKDAAMYLSLSPWKLRRLVWAGRLPVVQDCEGSPFLFDCRDLDSYVETNKRNYPL